ncbi:MAG: kynureninase [Pseudomonadota bacterium]
MTTDPALAFARTADADDPLRHFRERFAFPTLDTPELVYFAGHSLGLQPDGVRAAIGVELDDWARLGVDGHFVGTHPWYSYHERLTPVMATLVGARDAEVVCMNTLTTNLHLLFVSFYRPTPRRFKVLCEARLFPSDRYLLETQVRFHGFDPDEAIVEVSPSGDGWIITEADIAAALAEHGDSIALVFFGGVNFFTGQLFDIAALTRAAHDVGAIAGFDLAHAAGNVPLALHDWNVDFAAWCTYKYLNAGPGNVGALFVHERHGDDPNLPRFGGWWGHDKDTRFEMQACFQPMPGAEGWQLSNAPVFGMAALYASLEIFSAATMPALRQKSEALTAYCEATVDALAAAHPDADIRVITPRDPAARGAQLSVHVAGRGREFYDAMLAAGLIVDFREPCIIRFAPVPLYNSFDDVQRFGHEFDRLLAESAA